jgi:hypothetical protein
MTRHHRETGTTTGSRCREGWLPSRYTNPPLRIGLTREGTAITASETDAPTLQTESVG